MTLSIITLRITIENTIASLLQPYKIIALGPALFMQKLIMESISQNIQD
jgi:hypothetical protein